MKAQAEAEANGHVLARFKTHRQADGRIDYLFSGCKICRRSVCVPILGQPIDPVTSQLPCTIRTLSVADLLNELKRRGYSKVQLVR